MKKLLLIRLLTTFTAANVALSSDWYSQDMPTIKLKYISMRTELVVDHIVSWSKGGETILSNLRTLCSECNSGKSDIDMLPE
jgi:hypothetical protein